MPRSVTREMTLSYLTLPHLLPPDFVSVAHESGYQGISVRLMPASPPEEKQLPMFGSSPLLAETIARLDDTGLYIHDIEVLRMGETVDIEALERVMETAVRLRARNLDVIAEDPVEERLAENLARVAALTASYGVRTCLESMVYMATKTMKQAARVIALSGRDDIGVVVDSLHLDRAGDAPRDVCRLAPGQIACVQLCDAGPRPDVKDTPALIHESRENRMVPGEGSLPLRELLRLAPSSVPVSLEVPTIGLIGTMSDVAVARKMREAALRIMADAETGHGA